MPANRDPTRLSLVEKVFRQYLQVTRTFWKEAETRAAKIIPDWKAALGDGFAQQLILIDRQALRFGHLIATDEFVDPQLSLNDITERLAQDWSRRGRKVVDCDKSCLPRGRSTAGDDICSVEAKCSKPICTRDLTARSEICESKRHTGGKSQQTLRYACAVLMIDPAASYERKQSIPSRR